MTKPDFGHPGCKRWKKQMSWTTNILLEWLDVSTCMLIMWPVISESSSLVLALRLFSLGTEWVCFKGLDFEESVLYIQVHLADALECASGKWQHVQSRPNWSSSCLLGQNLHKATKKSANPFYLRKWCHWKKTSLFLKIQSSPSSRCLMYLKQTDTKT